MCCSFEHLPVWGWVGLVIGMAVTANGALPPVWVSDANRDGVLDASNDTVGEEGWAWSHGAIVPVDLDGG